jgi:uncharacterized protein (UPF0254 family)
MEMRESLNNPNTSLTVEEAKKYLEDWKEKNKEIAEFLARHLRKIKQ